MTTQNKPQQGWQKLDSGLFEEGLSRGPPVGDLVHHNS